MKNLILQGGAAAFLVSAIILQLVFTDLYPQSLNDYKSRSGGNWTNPGNWLRFNGSAWQAAVNPPDYNAGRISISAGHTVSYDTDVTVDQLFVETGALLIVNSGINFVTNNGDGDDVTVYGTLEYNGMVPSSFPGSGVIKTGGTLVYYSVANPANLFSFFSVKETGSNWVYRGSSTTATTVALSGRTYANLSFESSSGIYAFNFTGSSPLTVEGNFSLGSNVSMTVSNTAMNLFKGNYTVLGSIYYSTGTQTFSFAGSGLQLLSGNATLNFENANVAAGSLVKLNSNISVTGSLNAGGTIDCSDRTIGGTGAFSLLSGALLKTANTNGLNGSIVCATSSFASDAGYEFNGTSPQTTGSKLTTCGNITINNSSGVSLSTQLTAGGTVTFTSGKLFLGAYSLILGNTGSFLGAGTTSYIVTNGSGGLQKTGMPIGVDYLFPVGNSSYTPLYINNTGTADNFSVRTADTVDFLTNNTSYVKKKWVISEATPGSSSAELKFVWNTSDQNPEFNPLGSVCIGRYDGILCSEVSASVSGSGPYTASANGFSQFGEFAVGNERTLPADMIYFVSAVRGNNVQLKWKTSSEYNNKGFSVERRTADEKEWVNLGCVNAAKSTSGINEYKYVDCLSYPGIYYYRIKQSDYNGLNTYYYLKECCAVKAPDKFRIAGNFPNPFNSGFVLKYELPEDCNVSVNFFDITGKKIREAYFREYAGYSGRFFDFSGFSSGIYIYYIKALLSGGIMSAVGKCVLIK